MLPGGNLSVGKIICILALLWGHYLASGAIVVEAVYTYNVLSSL